LEPWRSFRDGLRRTREQLGSRLGAVLGLRGPLDPAALAKLEEGLLEADVGPAATERLMERVRSRMTPGSAAPDVRAALVRGVAELLGERRAILTPHGVKPWVMLVVGVNGCGKTTLVGKLAARFAREGRATLVVAADTFRAAAVEQLAVWAERAGASITRTREGADPAAVVHDGLSAARARGVDVALVDTAGRLHTQRNLMAELEKVNRVCGRLVAESPHHTLLVLDATSGQNALAQAQEFQKAIPITSLAINKLDGTARGGAVLSIVDQLGLPISVVGLGEGIEDWQPFDPEVFAQGLFEGPD
jgi:fused signal recognition particle receptor